MTTINQKEYLKKYLGIGKKVGEKKKKKKLKGVGDKIKIIDDDIIDLNEVNQSLQNDEIDEDAPQIVAIIDERPLERRIDEETKRALWEPIGNAVNQETSAQQKQKLPGFKIEKQDKKQSRKESNKYGSYDQSPPRKKNKQKRESRDLSDKEDNTPIRNTSNGSDDNSPPRKGRTAEVYSSQVEVADGDISPPRRNNRDEDNSPPRRKRASRNPSEEGDSPRKQIKLEDDDISPPRKRKNNDDNSPPRRQARRRDDTPPRKSRWSDNTESEDSSRKSKPEKDSSAKMAKTLDGKKAGLQNAKELAHETQRFRERENEIFSQLTKETSGVNAKTVLRDRKTGRVRNQAEEDEVKQKKKEEEEKQKEKYSRWGRGLVQIENRAKRIEEEIHEMSKPLARYADDEDLEKYLKEQERDGDPMLAYIRSKKRKDDIKEGKPMKPMYQGDFLPNRYGIRPGHRWDGVDRSNGYEKKWFDVQNEKRAQMEDSYKWSTEDM